MSSLKRVLGVAVGVCLAPAVGLQVACFSADSGGIGETI